MRKAQDTARGPNTLIATWPTLDYQPDRPNIDVYNDSSVRAIVYVYTQDSKLT